MRAWILIFSLLSACLPALEVPVESPPASTEDSENETVSSPLRIVILDVGQGDATLIVTPLQQVVLIDAGPPGAGRDVIIPFLETEGVEEIHSIFLSHYDSDHMGGLLDLLPGRDGEMGTEDDWTPKEGVFDRGDEQAFEKPLFAPYRELAPDLRVEVKAGDHWTIGGVHLRAIVVNGVYEDGKRVDLRNDDENGRSMALLIEHQGLRYLTTGDLPGGGYSRGFKTVDLETHLGELVGDIDVLHVGHHGSQTSSNVAFLDLVKPEVAIISVGENDFGHPADEVLTRLSARGIKIRQTFLEGTFLATF